MNETNSTDHDYKADYEQLELDDRADWDTARVNYRRLVHLWHPDRYAERPRELKNAQQQFILLTKSYDALKSFQRENDRLPFEPQNSQRNQQALDNDEQIPMLNTKIRNKTRGRSGARKPTDQRKRPRPTQHQGVTDSLDHESLARDDAATSEVVLKRSHTTKILWAFCGATLLFGTIVVFFMIDRSANQKIIEKGRAALRAAPPSEFMPSNAEIRRSETRGAFVQPPR